MDSEQKHTKGPWEIAADSRTLRQQLLMGGIAIKAYAPRYDEKCAIFNISTNKTFGGDGVTEANARLIAAAPTMYEALKALAESLDWESKRSGTTYAGHEDARAAIAKVEGR